MMHVNLLLGKAGMYIILEIRCSLHWVGESLEDGRCTPKMHVPSAPSRDRLLTDAGVRSAR